MGSAFAAPWGKPHIQQYLTNLNSLLLQCRSGDLPEALARKLDNATVLNGHTGCVNRLAWNQDGSLLASASDDCQVCWVCWVIVCSHICTALDQQMPC